MPNVSIHSDFERLDCVASEKQRKMTTRASFDLRGLRIGKLSYALAHPQAVQWVSDPIALKMLTLYLAAKDYLVESGIPKELAEIAARSFGNIKGSPLTPSLLESVLFTAAPWHIRAVRVYKLLAEEFKNGSSVVSYGCGSGIIEILALIASGNKDAKVVLVDKDPVGIELADKLVLLFNEHGYDTNEQILTSVGDIQDYELPSGVDTAISIGLLHNYFSLDVARKLMEKWFVGGARKIFTDVYYEPKSIDIYDAELRIRFVRNVLSWKFGPPDGLLFCNKEDLCDSLSDRQVEIYDHGLNATIVIS